MIRIGRQNASDSAQHDEAKASDFNTASYNDKALTSVLAYSDSPSHSQVETSSNRQQTQHTVKHVYFTGIKFSRCLRFE